MAKTEHVSVAVQDDFVARETRAKPIAALAEIIWNSLDADARNIVVEFQRNDLAGGLSKIVVYDDGMGFERTEAKQLFGNLGGSWKRVTRRTKREERIVHGQEGRGRYKAFALGRSVRWDVCYDAGDEHRQFKIDLHQRDLTDVAITEAEPASDRETGVIVTIEEPHRDFRVFDTPEGLQELSEIFALYLMNYRTVSVSIGGERLDPAKAIASQTTWPLPPIEETHPTDVHIIEWRSETKRTLYLCSPSGFPLEQVETRFHNVPGFAFSAYLRSPYVEKLANDGQLGLAEMDGSLAESIEHARTAIKDYFRTRAAERAKNVVEQWKAADVYPYKSEPETAIEKAERQVFDIVAVQIQEIAADIGEASKRSKALHLRMLRSAIERGPQELQTILNEVLNLPARQQKELAGLLQETSLSAIITAAKTVADRLKFINALESVVFDKETKKRLKERTQLHRILAENTWIFGEEYNLWVSDRDLKRVLEKYRTVLKADVSIDEPIKIVGKKRGIIDLMFSRATKRHRSNDREHLVVELKAPSVKVSDDELVQTKKYANAVANDERFRTVDGVRWHFWVVSNDYDDYTRAEIEGGPDPERRLVQRRDNFSVGVKTWGELIEENRARLQFFEEHLQHTADESAAIKYLRERHSAFLEGVFVEDDESASDELPSGEDIEEEDTYRVEVDDGVEL